MVWKSHFQFVQIIHWYLLSRSEVGRKLHFFKVMKIQKTYLTPVENCFVSSLNMTVLPFCTKINLKVVNMSHLSLRECSSHTHGHQPNHMQSSAENFEEFWVLLHPTTRGQCRWFCFFESSRNSSLYLVVDAHTSFPLSNKSALTSDKVTNNTLT